MNKPWALVVLAAALLRGPIASAQTSVDADRVLAQMEQQMRSASLEYTGEVITSRGGSERRKQWVSFRGGSGRTANRLIRFLNPADVRGVAFLSRGRADGPPDQWMYLPSMKRERRLAPQDRDAPFVGTDFSYADLEEFDRSGYTASLENEQTVDGEACYTIRLVPRTRSSYVQQLMAVSKSRYVPRTIAYFTAGRGSPAKTMSFFEYRQVEGYWVALHVEMSDAARGSRTIVRLSDVQVNRPQPADRFTIQNLVREGADLPRRSGAAGWVSGVFGAPAAFRSLQSTEPARRSSGSWPGFSGTLDASVQLFPQRRVSSDDRALGWTRLDVAQRLDRQRIRVAVAGRLEAESGGHLGSVAWDPADRALRRSPIALREASVSLTLARAIDLAAGKFGVAWGSTDTHSPAAGFLPRDLTDPFAWEDLSLWGARLTGERGGIRFDLYDAFVTTPWRLPRLDGRYSPGARTGLYFLEGDEAPPTRGFQVVRVTRPGRGWDLTGWVRTGVRPAPLFAFDIDAAEQRTDGRFVQLHRRFAEERAAGVEMTARVGAWLLRGELSATDGDDPDLGRAFFYTLQGEHAYRAGLVTFVYAGRGPESSLDLSTPFDRAAMPSVTVALNQAESWGDWRATWLGTLENAGGLFSAEVARPLDAGWRLIVGTEIPHGSSISAVGLLSSARRFRTSLQFKW